MIWFTSLFAALAAPPLSTSGNEIQSEGLDRAAVIRLVYNSRRTPRAPEHTAGEHDYQRLALPFDNASTIVEADVLRNNPIRWGRAWVTLVELHSVSTLRGEADGDFVLLHWGTSVSVGGVIHRTSDYRPPILPAGSRVLIAMDPVPQSLPDPLDATTHILTDFRAGLWCRKTGPGGAWDWVESCFQPNKPVTSVADSALTLQRVMNPGSQQAALAEARLGRALNAVESGPYTNSGAAVTWDDFVNVVRTRFVPVVGGGDQ